DGFRRTSTVVKAKPLQVALVSEDASPLSTCGGADADGQNVHVAALASELASARCEVSVYTRRDNASAPQVVPMGDRVSVVHVDAGPAKPIAKDNLFRHSDKFSQTLLRAWSDRRPDIVHSHFWMSGWASLEPAVTCGVPLVHTFHALDTVKRRQY